jgi:hypothetical protein
VTAGFLDGWTPIGAVQTASGYDVAFKDPSSSLYTVWLTDSNGNFLSLLAANLSGSSSALESLETTFQQDLNGDGVIGPATTIIESAGSTALAEVGNNYFLNPVAGGAGPELKLNGAAVVAGQSGTWSPIAAEQTATGYEVAWKNSAADQYTVWSTDSNGNFLSLVAANLSGSSTALETLEPSFHQDLNGDGVIGPATTIIESAGSTALAEVGNNYFLNPVAGGTGPELKLNGGGCGGTVRYLVSDCGGANSDRL